MQTSPEHNRNISIKRTGALSERQTLEVRQLADVCCHHDRIRLSYPTEEHAGAIGEIRPGTALHWLCYGEDGMLRCALALVFYQDSLAECSAFTHPDFRRQGLFSLLLEQALSCCGEWDILFTVSGDCPDTAAALQALGAEPESQEFQMELDLNDRSMKNPPDASGSAQPCAALPDFSLHKSGDSPDADSGETTWLLTCVPASSDASRICGSCRTSMVSPDCACLHHVEIRSGLRRQGYGAALILRLLSALEKEGAAKVILQVSGSNEAALALYKKTGFRITETLSCYIY